MQHISRYIHVNYRKDLFHQGMLYGSYQNTRKILLELVNVFYYYIWLWAYNTVDM